MDAVLGGRGAATVVRGDRHAVRRPGHSTGELRRALVNSGTLVVNRAYFLNNPALYANYLPEADPAERRAFTGLLNGGVIVPYLLAEHSPGRRRAPRHSPRPPQRSPGCTPGC